MRDQFFRQLRNFLVDLAEKFCQELVLLFKIEMAVNVNKRSNQFIQFVIEARAELFYSLKGQSHEISDPLFFINLVHGLRPFRI
jgi:hypothetical protein